MKNSKKSEKETFKNQLAKFRPLIQKIADSIMIEDSFYREEVSQLGNIAIWLGLRTRDSEESDLETHITASINSLINEEAIKRIIDWDSRIAITTGIVPPLSSVQFKDVAVEIPVEGLSRLNSKQRQIFQLLQTEMDLNHMIIALDTTIEEIDSVVDAFPELFYRGTLLDSHFDDEDEEWQRSVA